MDFITILFYTLFGTFCGTLFSSFPSLHIYNVAGIALIIWTYFGEALPYQAIAPYFISMIVAFSFINTIPMTFFGAPDESATVTILPGTKYLMSGRGYEAAVLSGVGGLIGVFLLVLLTPLFFALFPYVNAILSVHMHWCLLLVMIYMLMSEWPKGCGFGHTRMDRFLDSWGNIWAGLFTFTAAGILGIIITSRSIISPEMGFQNIMPVFVGLFAIPSIIQNLVSHEDIPDQHIGETIEMDGKEIGKAAFQGGIAGLIAAYFPAVTAGIGCIIASHTTALRGDILFIVGGAAGKVIYYVGAFLFLFILTPLSPNGLGKGGLNIILRPVFTPEPGDYLMMLGVIVFTGCISFLALLPLSRWTLAMLKKIDFHDLYWASFVMIVGIVGALTGFAGLFTMFVGTCIGLVPVFFHSRRSNCMSVLLIPICLNMAGYGDAVAAFMGLI